MSSIGKHRHKMDKCRLYLEGLPKSAEEHVMGTHLLFSINCLHIDWLKMIAL